MTGHSAEQFLTTRWSVVLTAGRDTPARAQKALAELCQTYWYPLYAYVRRRGHGPQDAEDLTQGFLARLLERHAISEARHERGRFRSFLLSSMNHFLSDEWDKSRAQKRGGERVISLDAMSAESRYALEPQDQLTPERVFERQWALRLLAEVLRRLEAEYAVEGKAEQFEHLRFCLTGQRSDLPYAELAQRMQTTAGAMKVSVHRLRQRYRAMLREEIAETVASEEEVEEELRALHRALAG